MSSLQFSFFQKILNFLPQGAPPPGPPSTRLGRPLKKCIFQTWPQNLYNQAAQVESFNFIPISSKMVQVMMVYEGSEKDFKIVVCWPQKCTRRGGDVLYQRGGVRQFGNVPNATRTSNQFTKRRGGTGKKITVPFGIQTVPPSLWYILREGDIDSMSH